MSDFVEDRSVMTRLASEPDRVLRYGNGIDHVADFRAGGPRALKRPLVMLFHGGFWRPEHDRTHTRPMAEGLAAAGWSVVVPEYGRAPGEPDATLADVAQAIRTLSTALQAEANGEIVLVGHSAGGHLVLWAAAALDCPEIRGVLALAPVADLQLAHACALDVDAAFAFLGAAPEKRADIDPTRMPSPATKVVILHGEDDRVVPLSHSRSYRRAHPQSQLLVESPCGHLGVIDPLSPVWPRVLIALEALQA